MMYHSHMVGVRRHPLSRDGGRGGLHLEKNKKRAMMMMVTMVQIIMRTMMIKGIIMMLTLESGWDGFMVDFTFVGTGGFT